MGECMLGSLRAEYPSAINYGDEVRPEHGCCYSNACCFSDFLLGPQFRSGLVVELLGVIVTAASQACIRTLFQMGRAHPIEQETGNKESTKLCVRTCCGTAQE